MTATQTDETRRVLDLLAQGKITVDEADRLITTLTANRPAETADAAATSRDAVRWIRINVHKPAMDGHRQKDVNIRVPIAVVRGGMRLGAIIGTFAGTNAARRMKAEGHDIDLAKISSDLSQMNGPEFDEFMKSLNETNIEIDDGKAQVRITAE
jgi:hypothetical protein